MEEQNKTPLYQNYNYDNVFNRSVIAGLLYLLNHKLTYEQVWDDNTVETVTVPFAYNFAYAKDQRFAQDNYTFFGRECFSDKFIDGKFDMCPRFAMSYTGSQIDAANITNRFVKGTYAKNENGKITSYTAFMYSIPLTMNFDFEGWIDNIETAFKIEQAIRETFYKNQTFNVLYRGMKIGCRAGFPESYTVGDKTVNYSFESESQLFKMTFNLSVETYQPCFDESQSIESDKKIEYIGYDATIYNNNITPLNKEIQLRINFIDTTKYYAAGQTIDITWKAISPSSDVYTTLIYYITPDNDKHIIDCSLRRNRSFEWKIPESISNFKQPNIVFYDNDNIKVIKQPKVIVIPESTGYVNSGCFSVLEQGSFSNDGYVQLSCDYMDGSSNIKIHDCYIAEVTQEDGVKQIYYYTDIPDTQQFVINNKKRLKYKKGEFGTKITVGVAYPMNPEIKDEIHNLLII